MMKKALSVMLLTLLSLGNAFASPASDALLQEFRQAGASDFSAERGKALWQQKVTVDSEERSCTSCHGMDLTKAGEHQRTHKTIQPMAASVNSERYTDVKEMNKWFKRNCKWAWGRECTPQEKADILTYLLSE